MYALRVKRENAQEKIIELKNSGDYDDLRRVLRVKDEVLIPVKTKLPGAILKKLSPTGKKRSLKDLFGIGSFDLIGDTIIIWIPNELIDKKKEIGEHALKMYPAVKAVYSKVSAVSGKYRVPKLELIAGKAGVTTHLENGLRFKLNVKKAYFSARQSGERLKLTKYVRDGDEVCVLFAGIGPIPVYVSKKTKAKRIVAVEINPDAVKFMIENFSINKCENTTAICGDAKVIYPTIGTFDLLILPLPKSSIDFTNEAHSLLKLGGRAIFYMASQKEELSSKIKKLKGFEVEKIRREIEISPGEYRYVVHVRRK
ncbi:MAG: hypothetical protein GOU98_03320 [Candidatus Altiarchaeota archaeon]|nr:hypothetical protein [Candidatus Altiarchaeota archaeon]